ncbi:hypothetical protein FOYG_10931 [Fusarium oxysporum NRRL 32931]|uniref:Uncharacterized protein n=1 Tax=Fusarium oxysporum NRRL 32931 TaxID=660029 RepID=W9HUS8_FUSOX|nr:hypothetical protein FOYG_10931 [Fusarium oxysporum NRRL 32931]
MGVSDSDYDCMALSGAHFNEHLIPEREKRDSVAKRER